MGKKRVSLYIDEEVWDYVKEEAWRLKMSASALFTKFVKGELSYEGSYSREDLDFVASKCMKAAREDTLDAASEIIEEDIEDMNAKLLEKRKKVAELKKAVKAASEPEVVHRSYPKKSWSKGGKK